MSFGGEMFSVFKSSSLPDLVLPIIALRQLSRDIEQATHLEVHIGQLREQVVPL